MLYQVPRTTNKTSRIVTLRHPNSMPCVAFRKKLLRDPDAEERTIGGAGVLSSEDEHEYTYERLGECRMLKVDEFVASQATDNRAGFDYADAEMFALIESEANPDESTYFTPEKHDVVYFLPGAGIAIAWQIVGVETVAGISPHNQRYALNKRDDLLHVESFSDVT